VPYIGQDLQVAFPSYTNIDDISGSFDGVTTSFPLTVGGVAPVPAPLGSNQCLISVDGVVQRPDDTGTEGFRLSGGNIIFSSAPSIADDFFGIILAGADYVNVGANFPDGTLGAPSITFDQDNDTGYYRSGSGTVSFASNGVAAGTWSSAGVTAPALIPTGSSVPANGVYLPAANTVGVATNGIGRLFVDASGNVGVGTPSPGSYDAGADDLVVANSGNSGVTLVSGTSSTGSIYFADGTVGNEAYRGRIEYNHSNDSLNFGSAGSSPRATIDSSGRLGIGTSAPSEPLDVVSAASTARAIRVRGRSADNIGLIDFYSNDNTTRYATIGAGAANTFVIETANNERLRVDSSGRVGIGTTSPTKSLEVAAGGTASNGILVTGSSSPTIQIEEASGVTGSFGLDGANSYLGTSTNHPQVFRTNNTERARIDSSGRLGIGTSSPGYRLDVTSQLGCTYSGALRHLVNIDSNGGKSYWYNGTPANTAYILGDTGDAYFAGRVGIGTASPGAELHVNPGSGNIGNIYLDYGTGSSADGRFNIEVGASAVLYETIKTGGLPQAWYVTGSERMRIDSGGRLLVGTSTARINVYQSAISQTPQNQIESDKGNYSGGLSLINNSTSGYCPVLAFGQSYSASIGGNGLTPNNEPLGIINFTGNDGNNFRTGALIVANVDGTSGVGDMPGRLSFHTTADGAATPTERMRIRNNGSSNFFAANDTIAAHTSASAGTSFVNFAGYHSATDTGDGTNNFLVYSNGNVVNTNNSYGAISDIKLKENIVDASSQWDDLKALQVRNYNFKEATGQPIHTQIGLVAQEAELVSPGLVTESPDRDKEGNDLGTVTKSVNYSVLYMKAVKALQEAMERIETLEAAVTALQQS
jgi:hypothetical protein